jgi:beta-glucosidase
VDYQPDHPRTAQPAPIFINQQANTSLTADYQPRQRNIQITRNEGRVPMKMFTVLFFSFASAYSQQPAYKNALLPVNERVEDLLSRMSIEEQASQLRGYFSRDTMAFDSGGNFVGVQDTAVLNHGVGTFGSRILWRGQSPQERARKTNGLQRYMLEKTRLGIPVFTFGESLHGYMANGATSFPQAIALGCTWDTSLVEEVFSVAAREASALGTRQVLSPVLDLARDPRWGRTEECYGEDPYLVSRMGMAAVFGFQGRDSLIDNHHVAVTLKHFAGHGQPEGGRNIAPVNYSEREFRENHLYPFQVAATKAHARSLMASYNEWDGIPNHVNHKLLTDILRNEWGFDGFVMSDGGGMEVTYRDHHAAPDAASSGTLSIKAGLDYELGGGDCFGPLVDEMKKGMVTAGEIRQAAARILRVKFECGLFDHPSGDPASVTGVLQSKEHVALALRAAREAIVLLKNDKGTLPFVETKLRSLAVIGPNAAAIHLGGYSPVPMKGISVLEGIQESARGKYAVLYAEGCKITMNKECNWLVDGNPVLSDARTDERLIADALKTARRCDAVVLVLGENELVCREAWNETHLGDRESLDLIGRQEKLAEAVLALGKPTVIVLINGRPISIDSLAKKAPAIVECWYLGQETGRAISDVIFGRINPSGKLTVTIPRSVGQLPCYYDRKPSRFRDYVLADSSPLFPFGYGLSYTSFRYSDLKISPNVITPHDSAIVLVRVVNTGSVEGGEIVQLYIHDLVSLPTRPVKELKDFARISLSPGESKIVTFTLTPEKLAAIGMDMKWHVPAGTYEIMLGRNSVDVLRDTLVVR